MYIDVFFLSMVNSDFIVSKRERNETTFVSVRVRSRLNSEVRVARSLVL
jgi:hypothetical protein